jgi:predicted ATPase
MKLITYTGYKSIVETPTLDEIPAFTLITGPNGAGKTHLLEAIHNGNTRIEGADGNRQPRMLSTSDLQIVDHISTPTDSREQIVAALHSQVIGQKLRSNGRPESRSYMEQFLVGNGVLTASALYAAERDAGKQIEEWTESDFAMHTPVETGRRDLFTVMLADVFFNYGYLHTLNGYKRWRSTEFDDGQEWLDESEFERRFGKPPWDVLNNVLSRVGLRYTYQRPEPGIIPSNIPPRLVDESRGLEVSHSELSSGEKTLLTIALSAYSVDSRQNAITLPSVILLDEPDATLHPSMVRSLLALVQSDIVGRLGIPVIMTTHSPTTVALADLSAIHLMSRVGSPRLQHISKDKALSTLLVGVPSLSVRSENRRTVIVESPNDERIYTKAAVIIAPLLGKERSLQFMAAGSKDLPNGCDAVIGLVSRLRENGNDLVWGLVDRDYKSAEPSPSVVFDASRHSLENVVLDPLALASFLLRQRDHLAVDAFGAGLYPSLMSGQGQDLVNWVTTYVTITGDDLAPQAHLYAQGLTLQVPTFWSELQGHALSDRLVNTFPSSLKPLRDEMLDHIVESVWAEHTWTIPKPTIDLFGRLLEE